MPIFAFIDGTALTTTSAVPPVSVCVTTSNATTAATTVAWLNNTTSTTSGTWVCIGNTMGTEHGASTYWQQVNQQAMLMMLAQQSAALNQYQQLGMGQQAAAPRHPSEVELAAAQARQEADLRRYKERAEAENKAHALLLSHLTPEQRKTFAQHGWFIVEGGRTKKRYRIDNHSCAGNIMELGPGDRSVATLCCHARENIPFADQHLTQKLMLESDEEFFLSRANRREVR